MKEHYCLTSLRLHHVSKETLLVVFTIMNVHTHLKSNARLTGATLRSFPLIRLLSA